MPLGNVPAVHLPANGYRRQRWRNGAGWTREILVAAASGGAGWDWRLSIAEIEADGPYSVFPGVEREQVLLSGSGLTLDFGEGDERVLAPPHGRQRFPGDLPVAARLASGRAEVFNLMWQPARVAAQLWYRPLVGSMLLFVEPGATWAVHVVAGRAGLGGEDARMVLEAGDTALLGGGPGVRGRQLLEGAGELILIRVDAGGSRERRPGAQSRSSRVQTPPSASRLTGNLATGS